MRAAADAGEDLARLGRGVPQGPRRGRRRPRAKARSEWETTALQRLRVPQGGRRHLARARLRRGSPTTTCSPLRPCRRERRTPPAGPLRLAPVAAAARHRRRTGPGSCEHARPSTSPRDLAPGTTLLEASAGTGKTWTIAALVASTSPRARSRLDEMLVVTFSRAASQELRERVPPPARRGRASCSPTPALRDPDNRLHDWLLDADAGGGRAALRPAHRRPGLLRRARPSRPSTSSASWCCAASAWRATPTPRAILVEDLEQLTTEIVDDLYLARFGGEDEAAVVTGRGPGAGAGRRRRPARHGGARAVLADAPDSSAAHAGRASRADVLEEVERRKRRLGVLQLRRPAQPARRRPRATPTAAARARMQHRWKFVLIDEFQDTDPVQWQVFERAFSDTTTMVLIGDPKQAIYAFRGGDIVTYLQAAESADDHADPGRQLALRPAAARRGPGRAREAPTLGDERIVVHPVEAHLTESRLSGAGAPFRLRVVRRAELGKGPRSKPAGGAVARPRHHRHRPRHQAAASRPAPTFDGRRPRAG